MDHRSIVWVEAQREPVSREKTQSVGAGFVIGPLLVLTAGHIVSPKGRNRVGAPFVYQSNDRDHARPIEVEVLWARDDGLDAALLLAAEDLGVTTDPYSLLARELPHASCTAEAAGFPLMSERREESFEPQPVVGTLQHTGPSPDELKLVPSADTEIWDGICGGPIFVGSSLVGIVCAVDRGFTPSYVVATPTPRLFADRDFRDALEKYAPAPPGLTACKKVIARVLAGHEPARRELTTELGLRPPVAASKIADELFRDRSALRVTRCLNFSDARIPDDSVPPHRDRPGPFVELLYAAWPNFTEWDPSGLRLPGTVEGLELVRVATPASVAAFRARVDGRSARLEFPKRGKDYRGTSGIPTYLETGDEPRNGQWVTDVEAFLKGYFEYPEALGTDRLRARIRGVLSEHRDSPLHPRWYVVSPPADAVPTFVETLCRRFPELVVTVTAGDEERAMFEERVMSNVVDILERDARRRNLV